MLTPPDELDLYNACDTDEIHRLAYELTAWGLRNGVVDELTAVDWALDQPRAARLPRGSSARLNPTKHHVRSGAQRAVDRFDPARMVKTFDPGPLHELAARISGSGVTHERYLLGAVSLALRFETITPVITGPLLAGAVGGVTAQAAGAVLKSWSSTMAYGFFTKVTYDGVAQHGRVWHLDVCWQPVSKPKHLPGCNRSRDRCECPGLCRKTVDLSLAADNDRSSKVRQLETWLASLKPGAQVTVTDTCKALGVTRHEATRLLEGAEGGPLKYGTFTGGRVFQPGKGYFRQGRAWFTQDGKG